MKRFLLQLLLFLLLGLPGYWAAHGYIYRHWRRPLTQVMWEALDRASRPQPYDRIILGDSVAYQLFNAANQKHSRYFHLPTNAATTLMGHYILLMEYARHNVLKEIVLLLHPYSLKDNLDRKYTANYVVGVFFRSPYRAYITPYAEQQIKNCRWWFVPVWLRRFPELCLINYQEVNPKPFWRDMYLSPLSLEYLQMLGRYCESNQVALRIVAPPLPEPQLQVDYTFMQEQVATHGLAPYFEGYFDFASMPAEEYVDELHPKTPFLAKARQLTGIRWELESP